MIKITILLDYKDRFETKFTAVPYRSGMDKNCLKRCFKEHNIDIEYLAFNQLEFTDISYKDKIYLYSSSEDKDGYYKSYIEDIIFGLVLSGAIVIPDYKYLRAHNNKVFMEILRNLLISDISTHIQSVFYGTVESLEKTKGIFTEGEYVIKPAEGSMSKGITGALTFKEILSSAKRIGRTTNHWQELKDVLRGIIYKKYKPDSKFRKKFIVQKMIKGLYGDWKILIYGNKYYILKRTNRENDFRASGGGRLSFTTDIPEGILEYSRRIYKSLNVPNLSMDIGYSGQDFYLFEFQCLYFGTYTLEKSDYYYINTIDGWRLINFRSILEEEYARSIAEYILKGFRN